jgi:hypothetical protein
MSNFLLGVVAGIPIGILLFLAFMTWATRKDPGHHE